MNNDSIPRINPDPHHVWGTIAAWCESTRYAYDSSAVDALIDELSDERGPYSDRDIVQGYIEHHQFNRVCDLIQDVPDFSQVPPFTFLDGERRFRAFTDTLGTIELI